MHALTRLAAQLEHVANHPHVSPSVLQSAMLQAASELRQVNSAPLLQQIESLALDLAGKTAGQESANARRIAEMAASLRREETPPEPVETPRRPRRALPWPRLRLVPSNRS